MESGEIILFVLVWILLSLGVASIGKKRRIGFVWAFVASLIINPIIGLIITLCTKKIETEYIDIK